MQKAAHVRIMCKELKMMEYNPDIKTWDSETLKHAITRDIGSELREEIEAEIKRRKTTRLKVNYLE